MPPKLFYGPTGQERQFCSPGSWLPPTLCLPSPPQALQAPGTPWLVRQRKGLLDPLRVPAMREADRNIALLCSKPRKAPYKCF